MVPDQTPEADNTGKTGLATALTRYCRQPGQARVTPLGQGLINDTYLIEEPEQTLVLQKINSQIFPEPERIIDNLALLSRHFATSSLPPGPRWEHCRLVQTRDGQDFFCDDQRGFWRALQYVNRTICHEQVTHADQAREVGRALGLFHRLTASLDARRLHVTLPGFHVLPQYLEHYDLLPRMKHDRNRAVIDFCHTVVEAHRSEANLLEQGRKAGRYLVRCVHGDPKASNVLFDQDSGLAVGLIDLDTIGPGLTIIDLGDCLRSCCSRIHEDSSQAPEFDLDSCRALLNGYFQEAPFLLTSVEREALFDALRLVTFELGLRFFSDHLSDDCYFKVKHRGDNLIRARSQFQLLTDIESLEQAIRTLIACPQ